MESLESKKTVKTKAALTKYCVTGASGYIGSWLVNTLLERGFKVHATVRDPGFDPFFWFPFLFFSILLKLEKQSM